MAVFLKRIHVDIIITSLVILKALLHQIKSHNVKDTQLVLANIKNTIILFVCTLLLKFFLSIVFISSWSLQWSQEKVEIIFMQNFGRQTKSIMIIFKIANWFDF